MPAFAGSPWRGRSVRSQRIALFLAIVSVMAMALGKYLFNFEIYLIGTTGLALAFVALVVSRYAQWREDFCTLVVLAAEIRADLFAVSVSMLAMLAAAMILIPTALWIWTGTLTHMASGPLGFGLVVAVADFFVYWQFAKASTAATCARAVHVPERRST